MTLTDAAALKLTPPLLRKIAMEIEGGAPIGIVRPNPDAVALLLLGRGTAASLTGERRPLSTFVYVLTCEDPQVAEAAAEKAKTLV